jgi:hypothetical protein
MAYRFIIAVDVEADDLHLAYSKLYRFMGVKEAPVGINRSDIDWESTDENYDEFGDEIDPDVMQNARMRVFAEENP